MAMTVRRGMMLVLLTMPVALSSVAAARPARRPIDTNVYVAIPSQAAAPSTAAAAASPGGGAEQVEVVGRRTAYVAAPVPDERARAPAGDGDFGIPLGPLGTFRLGGSADPDHDPVTGTYLAPFGEAYEGASPLMTR
ncbi:hypothetical protein [Gluconacetobacter takamatsuzukensis]|uniref:Uncharacterized protein n=1 Tax=Gluconacetobacter takamatsuzukensis TaxID=1286190 RepID=A0A7W4PQR8_9PROT|nr:hypothetical protein [Gluconacetobacter takamatsuzukensis]MBB2204804.1 hypothetical protein [Gluconacetobacter takamatsuzukensis]